MTVKGNYKSSLNTTATVLAAAGTYTGEWEKTDLGQIAVDCLANQAGTLTIEYGFEAPGGSVVSLESSVFAITANVRFKRAYPKAPGVLARVKYTNGAVTQTAFNINTAFGNNLAPYALDANGRMEFVQHAHPDSINAHMDFTVTGGTDVDIILVDLSDTTNFKHTGTDYLHIENLAVAVDAEANAAYTLVLGWLENVDGTNGDFHELHHISGTKSTGQNKFQQIYTYPNGAKLTSDFTITSDITADDTAFQTDVNLPALFDPATADTPSGSGDFVLRITSAAGANRGFNVDVTFSFHGH